MSQVIDAAAGFWRGRLACLARMCQADEMTCPLCGRRPARRRCPAKGVTICPTCCATKRLREINCPDDCQYLASARAHPAAVVQRQREQDVARVRRIFEGLSSRQVELFSVATAVIGQETPRPTDGDVAEAALAQAATLETAARGILYEHQPTSLAAQRLARRFREVLAQEEARLPRTSAVAAEVFRRIADAARPASGSPDSDSTSSFVNLLNRLRAASEQSRSQEGPDSPGPPGTTAEPPVGDARPRIILP
jgi:hypothetical protein